MTRAARALRDALAQFEASGHKVRGLRLHPNGTIDLLTDAPAPALASNDDEGDWTELAGSKDVSGAQGA